MFFHVLMMLMIYKPLTRAYPIFESKILKALDESSIQLNGVVSPIIYSDLNMRILASDLLAFWFSRKSNSNKALTIFEAEFETTNIVAQTDYVITIGNSEMRQNTDPSYYNSL